MCARALTSIALLLCACTTANALTAVCKNPTGRMFGVHGKALEGKSFDMPDAISNATFTVLWNKGEQQATIVTESSGGRGPKRETALLIFDTDEQLTFLVLYESAVWFYSIYPGPKMFIMTSHNNGASVDSGGAVVKAYQARCEMSE
jgi:hypothetical protein